MSRLPVATVLALLVTLTGACRSSPTRNAQAAETATLRAVVEGACPRPGLEKEWTLTGKLTPYNVRCAQQDPAGNCTRCEGSQALTEDGSFVVLLGSPQQWDNASGTPGCPGVGPLVDGTEVSVRGKLDPAGLPWTLLEGAPVLNPAGAPVPGKDGPDAVGVSSLRQKACTLPTAPVTVQGVVEFVATGCTKMLCPPANACCNTCGGRVRLHDLGEPHGAFLSQPACQGNNCELHCGDLQANATYEVQGPLSLEPQGLVLDARATRQIAPAPAKP